MNKEQTKTQTSQSKRFGVLMPFSAPSVQARIDAIVKACEGNVELDLFIDSGAFSAWTGGKEIDRDKYIEFIHHNKGIISAYANLDVIGDPKATEENQGILESNGLEPLPVITPGHKLHEAQKIAERYDYLCLSGYIANRKRESARYIEALQEARPDAKIHGFGLSKVGFVMELPYASIDSTSYWTCSWVGVLCLWDPVNEKIEYIRRPRKSGTLCLPLEMGGERLSNSDFLPQRVHDLFRYYGISIDKFANHGPAKEFITASMKGYIFFNKWFNDKFGRELRYYFAGLQPSYIKQEGVWDYLYGPLETQEA